METKFKIFVNRTEVLEYNFNYLKSGLHEVLSAIGIKMGQIGYNLPSVAPKGSIVVDGWASVCVGLPNHLYFESDSVAVPETIKSALEEVKNNYLEITEKLNTLFT